jgi:ribosomal subunit interface protein
MQIAFHSTDAVFTNSTKGLCRERFRRPVERYRLDEERCLIDVFAEHDNERHDLRVRLRSPGLRVYVSAAHEDVLTAVDMAIDKLSRKINDAQERKLAGRRKTNWPEPQPLGDTDFFTDGEEEVLREMNALDELLEA